MSKLPELEVLANWVYESQAGHSEWRENSWEDCEMKDGLQWTEAEWEDAVNAGIDPLTVNRIFPIWSLVRGVFAKNKTDIEAKARTHKDSETSQTMTESISYVLDQNMGDLNISRAFDDMITPGFGCLSVGKDPDPRKTHKIKVDYRDWTEMWWDPFCDPWFAPRKCRYVFHKPWMDVTTLQALFPGKEQDIEDACNETLGRNQHFRGNRFREDEATMVEERMRMLSGTTWYDTERKRVSPVEMWYTVFEDAKFAIFPDGRVLELKFDEISSLELDSVARNAVEIITARAQKMRVCTFLDKLKLIDVPSPHGHDLFPFVPFIGYLDRFKQPYGIPRQIKGQNKEINKRRSMILAQLKTRRAVLEETVVDSKADLQTIHEEVNKLDGFVVVKQGQKDKIEIIENMDRTGIQMQVLQQSEQEIEEISGGNAEAQGQQSNVTSAVGQQVKIERSSMMLSSIFENLAISKARLGELVMNGIQNNWRQPMYLRVTDRNTNIEKFITINEQVRNQVTGAIEVRNDLTQGRFDIVMAEAVDTDTTREHYLNLVLEWVKKSPPEVIPQLMNVAFEISNLPNKEVLLQKLRPILGIDPTEEDLTPDEMKQKVIQELEAQKQAQAQQQEIQAKVVQLEMFKKELENQNMQLLNTKIQAEINKLQLETPSNVQKTYSDIKVQEKKAEIDEGKKNLEAFKVGADLQTKPEGSKLKALKQFQNRLNREATA